MSAQVCLERTKCLLSTLSPPCLHPCLYHPSLPLQVLWAPLGSHPSLSHTGPIIGAAHKLVGLQMGRACRTCIWFLQPGQRPASRTKKKKKVVIWVWTSQCLQHVFKNRSEHSARLFLYILRPWVWGSVGWVKLREALELVWPLRT